MVVVQRFGTRPIADQKDWLLARILGRIDRHASQQRRPFNPSGRIGLYDDLCIGLRAKSVSSDLQVMADFLVTVDPAVRHNPVAGSGVWHGRVAGGREIEDRQVPIPKPHTPTVFLRPQGPCGLVVWPTVPERLGQLVHNCLHFLVTIVDRCTSHTAHA